MKELHWCNSHRCEASARYPAGHPLAGKPCCPDDRPRILLPCFTVDLTGIAEIIYTPNHSE